MIDHVVIHRNRCGYLRKHRLIFSILRVEKKCAFFYFKRVINQRPAARRI